MNMQYKFRLVVHFASKIFICILVSLPLATIALPLLLSNTYLQNALTSKNQNILIGITSIVVLLVALSWRRFNIYWWKYKNSYSVENPYFLFPDFIFTTALSTISFFIVFNHIPKASFEISIFFVINLIIIVFWFLSSYFWEHKEKKLDRKKNSNNEVSDDPINLPDEDLFNRERFVGGLYNELESLTINESFVYGLDASWGEGKTSVLNLLRWLVENNGKSSFLIVNFDPWNFRDEEAMLRAFFSQLERALSSKFLFPNLKKEIIKYQKLITSGISNTGFNIDLDLKEETVEEIRENIETYIQKTGKKLLIIIDEIDRLQEEEILMIFKLVRANSKFKNSIFILSLDTAKIVEPNTSIKAEYLEKIIQKPIPLPKIENTYINNFILFSPHKIPKYAISDLTDIEGEKIVSTSGFISSIENKLLITEKEHGKGSSIEIQIVDDAYQNKIKSDYKLDDKIFVEGTYKENKVIISPPDSTIKKFKLSRIDSLFEQLLYQKRIDDENIAFFDKEFVYLYNSSLANLVQNFRDAKRFLNSLYSSLPPIALEVNIFDFVVLEFIKVFAKEVYEDIYANWWIYVDQRYDNDSLNNPFAGLFSREEAKKRETIVNHINDLFKRLKYEKAKESAIRKALHTLFKNLGGNHNINQDERKDKRIFTTAFIKYFTLNPISTELSDGFFLDVLKSWKVATTPKETIKVTFKTLKEQDKLNEFLDKIRRIYSGSFSLKITEALIKAVYESSINFSRKNIGDMFDSEYERGVVLLLKLIDSNLSENQIQTTLEEIIKKTSDLSLAVDMVLTTKPERNGDTFNIYRNVKTQDLKKIMSDRLEKELIEQNVDFFDKLKNGKQWRRVLFQWSSNWNDETPPNKENVTEYIVRVIDTNPEKLIEFLESLKDSFAKEWSYNPTEHSKIYDLKILLDLVKKFESNGSMSVEQLKIVKSFIEKTETYFNQTSTT